MQGERFTGGTDSLILSWTCATAVVFLGYIIISKSGLILKSIAVFLMFCGFLVIAATGSRGPFLGLIAGAILTFFSRRNFLLCF